MFRLDHGPYFHITIMGFVYFVVGNERYAF